MDTNKELSSEESLALINKMIRRAQSSYHSSGWGPIMWGTIITVCALTTYFQIKFKFDLPFDIWLLTIIAVIPQIVISIREKRKRKVKAYEDVAMDYIWTCFGFAIFLLVHTNARVFAQLNPVIEEFNDKIGPTNFRFSPFSLSYFMIIYGIPTIITGGIMRYKLMIFGGMVCWVCALIAVYTSASTGLLLTALSATSAWLIPGLVLRFKYYKSPSSDV